MTTGRWLSRGLLAGDSPIVCSTVGPWARWWGTTPAGTQMARVAGVIHTPISVVTDRTPRLA